MCVCLASRYPRCLGAPQAGGHHAPAACSPCRARPCPPPTPQIPHQPRVSSSRPFPAKPNIGGGGAAAPPARSYPPKMSLGFTGTRGSAQGLPGAPLSPSTSLPSQGARALPGAPKFPSRGGAEAPPVPAGLGEGLASRVCSPQGLGGPHPRGAAGRFLRSRLWLRAASRSPASSTTPFASSSSPLPLPRGVHPGGASGASWPWVVGFLFSVPCGCSACRAPASVPPSSPLPSCPVLGWRARVRASVPAPSLITIIIINNNKLIIIIIKNKKKTKPLSGKKPPGRRPSGPEPRRALGVPVGAVFVRGPVPGVFLGGWWGGTGLAEQGHGPKPRPVLGKLG